MPEMFSGPWTIEVTMIGAVYGQRFRIEGSDNADGVYAPAVGGPTYDISGAEWRYIPEWSQDALNWQQSMTKRDATFSLEGGLVITIGADDTFYQGGDLDFDDLLVTLRCRDQSVNPHEGAERFDFTLPG